MIRLSQNPIIDPRVVDDYRKQVVERLERASVRTVGTVAQRGRSMIRQGMAGASLGRLGNAIGSNADETVIRRGAGEFSTSARFFTRSRSERTLGALEAYTQGAQITPSRGRWLWIPTDNIPRVSKRQRLSPAMWRANGFDKKIGPLIMLKSVNGHPLLAIENVGVDLSGRKRSAKSLKKSGAPRKRQVRKELVIAFVGIPRTARAARINLTSILESARAEMPAILSSELAKEGN
ncbi:MAG: hypothetical protein AB7E24_14700 [Novosphingobium sp.]